MDDPTDDAPAPGTFDLLTIAPTFNRAQALLLEEYLFEDAGLIRDALKADAFDGHRIVYAITNPEQTEVVYIGDTETGRNLRARLRAHMRDREKIGHVELDSRVYVHLMITEFIVLDRFHEETGKLPVCNKRKVDKYL